MRLTSQHKRALALVAGLATLAYLTRRARAATPPPQPGITLPTFFEMNGQCRKRIFKNGQWFSEPVAAAFCNVDVEE